MRNPFRLRASKRSVRDEQFVRLFAAGALDLLNDADEPWAGVVFLRSAPGGGKTTLLRLLTPGPLKKIFRMQDDQEVRPTRDALMKAGAITVDGLAILGVMIGFTNEYRDLDEIGEVWRARERRIPFASECADRARDPARRARTIGKVVSR